ncbi:conserved unknown protein [Ectocarpus siliculosus]|uniref:Uncharacterized protein n=1 Tax=Ectocarpus siliculosus TaxID=2880 RepID=D7G713_ECTSI|nr:conserved unknown protein [Ectocarpus siliculosus]|eukprot:CBJ25706.1 conserved unknown protein [Ectocarpus siliculosus]
MATTKGGPKNAGDSGRSKRGRWRESLRRKKKIEADAIGDAGEAPPAPAAVVVAGKRRGKRSGGGKKRNGRGDDSRHIVDRADETAAVPLLELVDELVRNAMFSPIGARDVMMSQALAAEFPTAAGVRPVFGSLANVYELLRRRCRDVEWDGAANDSRGEDAAAAAKRIRDSERAMLPFEGRLLVFWRGNGVEETRGRLLLKKLDYLQSNAVGWLSQSVTDSLKAGQQQVVGAVDTVARDLARRKDSVVRSLAEGAIAFGLERDSLTQFLPVSNVTEMALTKEQEALDEALEALRRNSRRGPVNLQRYGMREVNVKLEEFSEGGAWPPGDDSWFWEPEVPAAADTTAAAGRESTKDGVLDEGAGIDDSPIPGEVPSTVLPRVTLASVLSPSRLSPSGKSTVAAATTSNNSRNSSNSLGQIGPESAPRSIESSKSALSRLLSKCTVKEPTYDEVVVVYFKRTRRPIFKTPATLATLLRAGTKIGNKVRGVEKVDAAQDDADEVKAAGLGLQLRVYRGVPLVNLNSIAPDKKVEVRPQTALRLDLNTVVGLGLVLANLRFDSPVLVAAATVSVVLLVIRTIVGYLNARIRVESFVSRDILDKTMGSNVPVLRHLAEEAAQQKSRHVAMVYASLLQCAIDTAPEPAASSATKECEWGELAAVSIAAVSRHCDTMMKACVALPWEAKLDVPYWLKELENLKILVRLDEPGREGGGDSNTGKDGSCSLPLALEDLSTTAASAVAAPTAPPQAKPPGGSAVGSSAVVFYRLLDPEAAVEQLKSIWSELVEPPPERFSDAGSRGSGEPSTPWRRIGGASD